LTFFGPGTPLGAVGERELLRRLRARVPLSAGVSVGIGDDAAAVQTASSTLVTTDTLVEGVHFLRDAAPPRLLGRKALSINLSDLAAMGGLARYATVSLCLPPALELSWVDSLYDGLLERAAEAGVAIVGGNVSRAAAIVVDVALLGEGGTLLLRSGARPGDCIVVSGGLGAAAEGARLLADGARVDDELRLVTAGGLDGAPAEAILSCLRAQLDPRPPLALARAIAERGLARAAMDLSDGLSSDLPEICEQSGVRAVVDAAAVPVQAAAAAVERARGGDPRTLALHGGEDYELLLAVDPDELHALVELARVWEIELSVVGAFLEGEPGVRVRDARGERPLAPRGPDHYAGSGPGP
jgi:thiamine-monophosphate kinase